MPSYDFKCTKCETIEVHVFSMSDYDEKHQALKSVCCNEPLVRIIRSSNIIDNCNGFYGRNKG